MTVNISSTPVHLILHMGLELQNSFKEVARGVQYGKLTGRHQGFKKICVSKSDTSGFLRKCHFLSPGGPRKGWGTYFHVKSKNNWGPFSSLFSILAIKMHFWPIYCYFLLPHFIAVNWQKMHFNGQNRKK